MNPDEIRRLIATGELATPCQIVTRSAGTYTVTDRRNVWMPEAYPDTLVIATRDRGLALIGLTTIEAIHLEREAAGVAR